MAGSSSPIAALAGAALVLILGGCGSSGSSDTTSHQVERAVAASAAARRAAEAKAPKGASATLRAIYAEFPVPRPDPEVKGSAAAIAAGEMACAGKTPLQVKDAYLPAALARGVLKRGSEEARAIARIARLESRSSKERSFVAGQLAADAYKSTLPEALAPFGYQGCVHALAVRLEHELAPRK